MKPRIVVTTALLITLGLATSSCNFRDSNLNSGKDATVEQKTKVPVEFFSCLNADSELTVSLKGSNGKDGFSVKPSNSETRAIASIEHYGLFFLQPGTYNLDVAVRDDSQKSTLSASGSQILVQVEPNQPLRVVYQPILDNSSTSSNLLVKKVAPSKPERVAEGVTYLEARPKCSEASTLTTSKL